VSFVRFSTISKKSILLNCKEVWAYGYKSNKIKVIGKLMTNLRGLNWRKFSVARSGFEVVLSSEK
jgi:hypothetical protein